MAVSLFLVRYRCSHNGTFESYDHFSAAQEHYLKALQIDTQEGIVFNQLAVIENLKPQKSLHKIVFYYLRALVAQNPFPAAKDNLLRLIRKPECVDDPVMKVIRRLSENRPLGSALEEVQRTIDFDSETGAFISLSINLSFLLFQSDKRPLPFPPTTNPQLQQLLQGCPLSPDTPE